MTEDELNARVEKYSRSETRSAALLIAALFLEAFFTWFFADGKSIAETRTFIVCDLAVGIAVVGEVLFAHKADAARKELEALSNERVAKANQDAARALERAAILEGEAAALRRRTAEIEKVTAWRRLSDEQFKVARDELWNHAEKLNILIEYQNGDPEAWFYANELAGMFFNANVKEMRFEPNFYLGAAVFGTYVTVSPELRAVVDVYTVLFKAGIPFIAAEKDLTTHLSRNQPAPNLYIFVGAKHPVLLERGGDAS